MQPLRGLLYQLRDDADATTPSDGQLLRAFLQGRDEAAFETLVRRHGTMVLGVCRRLLTNVHDAEDAFQATFLVLVRQARSVARRDVVGNWLYGVAYHTALKARALARRRQDKERAVPPTPRPAEPVAPEWLAALDEELHRLPDKYRSPLVLCDLEGMTRKDAARLLRWPEGTVHGRLARARALLAKRLTRRGVALSAPALATGLAELGAAAGPPATLIASTVKVGALLAGGAGASALGANVLTLTQGVIQAMFLAKLRTFAVMVGVLVLLGLGAGHFYSSAVGQAPEGPLAQPSQPAGKRPKSPPLQKDMDQEAVDRFAKLSPEERARLIAQLKDAPAWHTVARGEAADQVVERGSLEAVRTTRLSCSINSFTPVISWVLDDGSWVKKGDKLLELDDRRLRERMGQQRAAVERAKVARELAESEVVLSRRESELTEREILVSVKAAANALEAYQGNDAAQREALTLKLDRAKLTLERARLTARHVEVKTQADLRAKTAKLGEAEADLRHYTEELASCVLTAPHDGVLLYPQPDQGRSSSPQPLIAVGEPVQPNQVLLHVTDLERIAVRTYIHENQISRVRKEAPADVRIDAYPNQVFSGKVATISNTAAQAPWLNRDVKVYSVAINLDGTNKRLRPGMSAEIALDLGRRANVLTAPASALVTRGAERFCFVRDGDGKVVARTVITGVQGEQGIEIREGLQAGDQVLADPRAVARKLEAR
jgi:RND family efflux transporter MFP subunit